MGGRRRFGTVLGTVVVWATSVAAVWGQAGPAVDGAMSGQGDGSLSPFSEPAMELPSGAGGELGFRPLGDPRWTASAEYVGWNRVGGAHQTLVSSYPPHDPIVPGTGVERLNSSELNESFASGSRLTVRQSNRSYDLEFSFLEINGWSQYRRIEPNVGPGPNPPPPDWLVFMAPGDFVQLTDYPDQAMAWDYATRLYNGELNVRWDVRPRLTMLAGFRWVNLGEELVGSLPPERAVPFWETKTRNNLYGLQIGGDWKILNRGRFSMDGLVKVGVFDNNAQETTVVSIYRTLYSGSAATNHFAFLGELGLQGKYQLTEKLLLKAGYEVLWLDGVALAPSQIPDTFCHGTPLTDVYVRSLGIDSSSGLFFHGVTAGLEYAF